jgi:adenosylhomocysteine nucleosidase
LLAFVAAEAREFAGLLRHAERVVKLNWPIDFATRIWLNGRAAVLVANGPGPKLAGEAVEIARRHEQLSGLVSTGFCGALDPALKLCDIFVATSILNRDAPINAVTTTRSYQTGRLASQDRVASTAAEKSELHQTGASAVEMEASAVAAQAAEHNLPFYCIRVVSDTAGESLPLDFNQMRDASGRFSTAKILTAALRRPSVFPGLIELNKRSKAAAQALGDFLADTRF